MTNTTHAAANLPELFSRDGTPVKSSAAFDFNPRTGSARYNGRRACIRCGGVGGSDKWVATGWTCYNCGGAGYFPHVWRCYTSERLAKLVAIANRKAAAREAAAAAKAAAYRAEQDAAFDAWHAANASAVEALYLGRGIDVNVVSEAIGKVDNRETLRDQHLDVALSIIVARLAVADQKAASTFVGKVGERVELDVVLEKVVDISYGSFPTINRYIYLMRDAAGNRIIYKGTALPTDEGSGGKIRATVAAHEEYRGERQTIVQRPKIID